MPDGLWIVAGMIAGILVFTLARVVAWIGKSERQWRDADKSKLRDWDDEDDDWP